MLLPILALVSLFFFYRPEFKTVFYRQLRDFIHVCQNQIFSAENSISFDGSDRDRESTNFKYKNIIFCSLEAAERQGLPLKHPFERLNRIIEDSLTTADERSRLRTLLIWRLTLLCFLPIMGRFYFGVEISFVNYEDFVACFMGALIMLSVSIYWSSHLPSPGLLIEKGNVIKWLVHLDFPKNLPIQQQFSLLHNQEWELGVSQKKAFHNLALNWLEDTSLTNKKRAQQAQDWLPLVELVTGIICSLFFCVFLFWNGFLGWI